MKTISVCMAARGTSNYVAMAVGSVLCQRLPSGWNLELLLVADGGEGDDYGEVGSIVNAVAHMIHDHRLRVFTCEHSGCYPIRNALIPLTEKSTLVFYFDSDDVLRQGCIATICRRFDANPDLGIIHPMMEYVDQELVSLKKAGRAHGCFAVTPEMLNLVGGFECWPGGADTEFLARAEHMGCKSVTVGQGKPAGVLYRRHDGQLTHFPGRPVPTWAPDHVPEWRRSIFDECCRRQAAFEDGEVPQRIDEPVMAEIRPCNRGVFGRIVHVHMCTYPAREMSLPPAFESLHSQLGPNDSLFLSVNHYNEFSACGKGWLYKVSVLPNVTVTTTGCDLGDAAKYLMMWMSACPSVYVLTCDDDIVYPPDYVRAMVANVDKYDGRAAVSAHGTIYRASDTGPAPAAERQERERGLHCMEEVVDDESVHVLGTGVCAFRVLPMLTTDMFPVSNMCDIWFAALLQRHRIPAIVIAHEHGWLRSVDESQHESIWEASVKLTGGLRDRGLVAGAVARALRPWKRFRLSSRGEVEEVEQEPAVTATTGKPWPSTSRLLRGKRRVTIRHA